MACPDPAKGRVEAEPSHTRPRFFLSVETVYDQADLKLGNRLPLSCTRLKTVVHDIDYGLPLGKVKGEFINHGGSLL